jgi:hypothetical protein
LTSTVWNIILPGNLSPPIGLELKIPNIRENHSLENDASFSRALSYGNYFTTRGLWILAARHLRPPARIRLYGPNISESSIVFSRRLVHESSWSSALHLSTRVHL